MNQDDIICMARKAGFHKGLDRFCPFRKLIERFAVLVAAAEREACAIELENADYLGSEARHCAIAIRAKGNNEKR